MERNITITLKKAREWYNGDNKSLREVALQAFTEEELKQLPWESIKTFEDAIKALNISTKQVKQVLSIFINAMPETTSRMMVAQYKLYLIRKALNGPDWKPSLNNGDVYYPYLNWYLKGQPFCSKWIKLGEFNILHNDNHYILVGTFLKTFSDGGLGNVIGNSGNVNVNIGLFSCKSAEITKHFVMYFGRLIFEATYGQYNNYMWLN